MVEFAQNNNSDSANFLDGRFPSPFEPGTSLISAGTGRLKQIWSVGGGKGGVGKSLISSSLAVSLAKQGKKVVAIDVDLGGANLHTTLGVELPRQTLGDFFSGRAPTLAQCICLTGIPNLELISGAQDSTQIANLSDTDKERFLIEVRNLDADYVIFDLGAGTANHTIDFFLASEINLISMLPEPTSIENAYRFIKSAYYRRLQNSEKLRPIRDLIETAMDSKNTMGIRSPSDLFKIVNRDFPHTGTVLREEIEKFHPKLIINQVRTHADIEIGHSVKTVCKKYFGIDLDYLGYLDYDSSVWQAIRRKRPALLEFPNSKLTQSVERMCDQIIKRFAHERSSLLP